MENIKLTGLNNFINQNTAAVLPKTLENEPGMASAGDSQTAQQADFQLEINDRLSDKILEVAKNLESRKTILADLTPELRVAVNEILQQGGTKAENLSNGLADVFRQQKNTADTLTDFAEVLLTAATLVENGEMGEAMASKLLEQFAALRPNLEGKVFTPPDILPDFFLNMADEAGSSEANLQKEPVLRSKDELVVQQEVLQQKNAGKIPEVKQLLQVANDATPVADNLSADEMRGDLLSQLSKNGEKSALTPHQATHELLKLVRNVTDNSCEAQLQKLTALAAEKPQPDRDVDVKVKEALAVLEPKAIAFLAERYELPGLKNIWVRQAAKEILPFAELSQEENQSARKTLQEIGFLVKGNLLGPLKTEAKEQLTVLIEKLPQVLQEKLADEGQKGQIQKQIVKLENTLLLTQGFKDALQPANSENYSAMVELKGELNKILPQGEALELNDIVKMAKQVALRDVLGEQLKGALVSLEKGLALPELKENPVWKLLQQNDESNKGGQRMAEAALKLNNPLVAKTALLLRTVEAAEWRNHSSVELRTAAAAIKELTATLPKQDAALGARQTEHSVLSFATELQMAQGVIYPAQIHIYHQHPKEKGRQEAGEYETWLRISLETENIGAVTAVFRISEQDRLDVRVGFKVTEALQEFRRQLPELRKSLEGERLKLRDLGGNKI